MEIFLTTHDSFALHDAGRWHPERPERLAAAVQGVYEAGFPVQELTPPPVDRELLESFHDPSYVADIEALCRAGGGALDPDTQVVAASWEAATRAAGAGVIATAALRGTDDLTAFLAVRPPGHHALTGRAMGFCIFNNIGITAHDLVARGERVAIVDWDVHHGNGTEASFVDDPAVLYVSFHQHPFYPGTGWLAGVGTGHTAETTVNVPVPAGTAGDLYRAGFEQLVSPIVRQFSADWILVSCGYDAHRDDPLAELQLVADDFRWMARALADLLPPNRIVFFLEGGYDLAAISAATAATLQGTAGQKVAGDADPLKSPPASWRALDVATRNARNFWDL